MSEITRLPTKFGAGHSEAIGFFQDEIMPALIANEIAVIIVRGVKQNGDEIEYTMVDCSGERSYNLRMLGQIAEAQTNLVRDLSE